MAGSCVRVDPPFVEFNDVKVGRVYKTAVTAANVGKTLKKITIGKPALKLFKFTASSSAELVAPGLSVGGLLEFTPEEEEEVRDCLLIHIDEVDTIEVPLLGFPRACSLLMDSVLDFGCIAASSQVISKHHHITNQGSAPGVFHVQYDGDPSVRLSPCSGVVAAGATQWLQVELRTDGPRHIDEKALVKLQNRSSVVLSIRAEVVDQRLEVFDLQGAPLSCLWFGPVYFGTSRVGNVVLRNNAPQACDWVCLLQETASGTEMGTDLQKSTDATLLEKMEKCSPATQGVSQVFVCVPKQGRLGPYDKTTVTVRFSPMCKSTTDGKKRNNSASRQDYCLFLLFESVGSRYGFTHHNGNSSVELAVTGSGLPVSLVPSPSQRFDFLTCVMGQRVDLLCVLQNLCPQLPVNFRFRRLAHFTAKPSTGTISPGQCQDVVLSFTARQQGSFQVRQKVDVLGHVVHRGGNSAEDDIRLKFCSFHTITLHLSAVCHSETTHPVPKLNPGITPAVTNPTGSRPHVQSSELARCRGMAHAAVLSADKTRLHVHRRERSQNTEGEEFLAFPNDRATSIRPASAYRQYRTIFTGVHRYRYVDTNYAFTEAEEEQRQQHQQIYTDFIKQLRQTRLQKIKQRQQEKAEDDVDIGIVPSQGLVPPALHIRDLESSKISETKSNLHCTSPATKHSCLQDMTSITRQVNSQVTSQVSEVMNAVPSTSQEVADCNRTLTAQELYKVDIGPLSVDFGEVCVQSVCVQNLELINHLSVFVWVQLEVDCPELQGSSPLSHVLPPHSHSSLPLTFQSNKLGPFYRPISYSVNHHHPGQILVQAQVVPLALELSTSLLVLHPTPFLLAQSGYRNSVTLRNQRNHAAEFTWRPVVTESGILFSIRPATGTVEPYSELDCEVVWHPSFSSPSEGDFDLCVHEGNTQRLHCVAKVGSTGVQLADKQVLFGSVPLNMLSIRTAVLHNTGQNHAYYQVLDLCPLPGMVVSPPEGVVPSGGQAALKIHFHPDSVIKFDTRVEIALRSMKSIELRVGGSVEPPNIDISVANFQFYGVHAGSQRAIPFALTNRSSARARVAFNLSEYTDFSLQLPQPSAKKEPGVSVVEVQGNQTVDCSLVFSPTQAASYDFCLPLMVNGVRWPTASLSPLPTPSSSSTSSSLSVGSRKHVIKPLPPSVTMATPQSQRIQATVLCAPLEMSPSRLQFHVEPLTPQSDVYTKTVELKAVCEESVFWRSGVRKHVNWWFDCSAIVVPTEDRRQGQLCTVSPSSGSLGPGQSICLAVSISPEAIGTGSGRVTKLSLPLYLGDKGGKGMGAEEGHQPYRQLSITVTLQFPCITIHPPQILLTPVPLESNATATLTLLAFGYPSGTEVSAEVDEVDLEDGTKIQPVSVIFPEGNNIPTQHQDQRNPVNIQNPQAVTSLICSVSFCSTIPLSFCTTITFTDHLHNRFKVKLYAIADNCLLTVWPFMALHRSEQQIVLKTGATAVEAILQRYHTPSPASGPTSSSSSLFDHNSSTNKNSVSDSDSVSGQASTDTDNSPNRDTLSNLGIPEFPAANSEEGLFYQNVLLAVERWFSLFGWPSGPHPISVPHTLRRVVSKIQMNPSSRRAYRVSQNKDSRSVVDMLHHLIGKQIPGIPRCQAFSSDVDQRTNQLLQQHEAMLAFLRVQGACLCHIRPEYLLDMKEFRHWCSLQSNEEEHGLDYSSVDYESLSKQSWTDVLLQIYKVLVLGRVSECGLNTTLDHEDVDGIVPVGSQPLASNIYSSWELQLLSWLNKHYQSMRNVVWGTGGVPSARWIVNFDLDLTDGLVLAALLAAYCPYLICSHFGRMYTTTNSLEQILHNNIIVSQALTALCLNLDVQPTDLSDPNPVQMLMLCVHLYERLPQYLPLHTITLSGGLHSTFRKQVRLKSPSSKPVKYQAFLFGGDAHLFSLPDGCTVTIPPKASTELTIHFSCSFMQPMEAVLLLISNSPFGLRGTTLAFNLKTHVSHITPTNIVKCKSPCYQLKVVQLPITNLFSKEAKFRVVLVESAFNPLEPEKKKDSLLQQASFKANIEKMTSDKSCEDEMEGKCSDLDGKSSEFLSRVRTVCLKSGQANTLNIHYLPFCLGTKYCSVLLVCPQVGDMVYMVKATAELPLPSPLSARPSSNILSIPSNSDPAVCVSVLSLRCQVGQVVEEVVRLPLINMAWEQALAIWGQHSMSADEHRRRMLTHTLHSSTVRAATAARTLLENQATLLRVDPHSKGVEYSVEVSMPQYFSLPSTVTIPIKEDINIPWENPADCGCVDIPLRFQADSVGKFTCQVVLRSWCDTRVYALEVLVTSQGKSVHLDFSSPAHHSVTQDIPLQNETNRDWKMQAEVCGEGFSSPKVVNVPAGTRARYPLTFQPTAQCIVTGKLSLHNDCDGTEHVFNLRGVGEHPLPVDHVVLHCPVGQTTHTQLDVPNYSQNKLTLKVVTDLSVVSGTTSLEIKPGDNAPYTLAVLPWKRGKQTGCLSFLEIDMSETDKHKENVLGRYEVHFSVEIICEPAAPIKVIDVQCAAQSSVAIEVPVSNPRGELLMLDVCLEGDDLSGASWVSIPPRETLTYKATFSPGRVGKSTGSVLFQSELVGEFWYQLELYALPPPVTMLPQACCQLGKWTRQTIPLVNPTAETLELTVANSNHRNYKLEMDSGSTLIVEPHSSTELGVRFSPSSIGEGNHTAKITFKCPELQEWCVLLRGRGLNPESEEPLSISSLIGSNASITIPFTNPTESPVMLNISLTDEDPSGAPNCHQVSTEREVFSIPLSQTEGIQISEGATFDVPVVFAPNSMGLQQAWLCLTMKPISSLGKNSTFSTDNASSEQELSTICLIYPLRGIPMEMPVENSPLGLICCEAGCQLERKVDILLTGCVPGNQEWTGQEDSQMTMEDFLCEVRSDSRAQTESSKVEDCLSASVEAARRDPETGIVTLTLNVVYTPLSPCRCSALLSVQSVSGGIWEYPVTLIATEPQVDDVIITEATELGKTSAVGFRLTSTTRRPEPFTAAFLPGSSSEFTVTPASGMLPPVGSAGALITVSFTPTMYSKHRARLTIQAADMQWTYEVRGKTFRDSPPLCKTSTNGSSSVLRPAKERQQNFVAQNLRLPVLANSSPLKVRR
ncbi:cilia- and flagella-associated protein 47-like isoform X2 [Dicentrarchus labrax]|uniref:cilia- and flagella-associated protein 47-like isoform X2 n=1 Tax=Dicentrarchus labrax TaxID=13489 RepID=UPI0021F52B1B|nr:cilia- and flagella-associated protein 47-like isoform X2 [Dicentrarchus labrax]